MYINHTHSSTFVNITKDFFEEKFLPLFENELSTYVDTKRVPCVTLDRLVGLCGCLRNNRTLNTHVLNLVYALPTVARVDTELVIAVAGDDVTTSRLVLSVSALPTDDVFCRMVDAHFAIDED